MQIIGTCRATGALAAKAARIVVIAVAAVLVAASVATSISRPEPKPIERDGGPRHDPETITTTDGENTLVTLNESTTPVTPSPAVPAAPVVVEPLVWDALTGAWSKPELTGAANAGYVGGASVPVLLRLNGTVDGASYRVDLHYSFCMARYKSSFDHLSSPTTAGDLPWLTAPAPGRGRPDSMIASPGGHAGGKTVSLLAWGATFSAEASGAGSAATCDAVVRLEMVARSNTVSLGLAGHLRPESANGSAGFAPMAVFVARIP